MMHSSFPPLKLKATEEEKCYKVPDAPEVSTFVIKEIDLGDENHYTLQSDDSNDYLVFNSGNNVIIHIPDNMLKGFGVIAANVGSGTIEVVMDGLEELRSWHTLTDPDSFMTLIKITDKYWQSSERQ